MTLHNFSYRVDVSVGGRRRIDNETMVSALWSVPKLVAGGAGFEPYEIDRAKFVPAFMRAVRMARAPRHVYYAIRKIRLQSTTARFKTKPEIHALFVKSIMDFDVDPNSPSPWPNTSIDEILNDELLKIEALKPFKKALGIARRSGNKGRKIGKIGCD